MHLLHRTSQVQLVKDRERLLNIRKEKKGDLQDQKEGPLNTKTILRRKKFNPKRRSTLFLLSGLQTKSLRMKMDRKTKNLAVLWVLKDLGEKETIQTLGKEVKKRILKVGKGLLKEKEESADPQKASGIRMASVRASLQRKTKRRRVHLSFLTSPSRSSNLPLRKRKGLKL